MVKLVADWRDAHKFLSVIAAGVGAVAYTASQIVQDAHGLGIDLPDSVDHTIAYLTFAGVVAGRLIKQFDYD